MHSAWVASAGPLSYRPGALARAVRCCGGYCACNGCCCPPVAPTSPSSATPMAVEAQPYAWPCNGARLSPSNTCLLIIDMQASREGCPSPRRNARRCSHAAPPLPPPPARLARPAHPAWLPLALQVDFCGEGGYVQQMGYDISLTRKPIQPIRCGVRQVAAATAVSGVRRLPLPARLSPPCLPPLRVAGRCWRPAAAAASTSFTPGRATAPTSGACMLSGAALRAADRRLPACLAPPAAARRGVALCSPCPARPSPLRLLCPPPPTAATCPPTSSGAPSRLARASAARGPRAACWCAASPAGKSFPSWRRRRGSPSSISPARAASPSRVRLGLHAAPGHAHVRPLYRRAGAACQGPSDGPLTSPPASRPAPLGCRPGPHPAQQGGAESGAVRHHHRRCVAPCLGPLKLGRSRSCCSRTPHWGRPVPAAPPLRCPLPLLPCRSLAWAPPTFCSAVALFRCRSVRAHHDARGK